MSANQSLVFGLHAVEGLLKKSPERVLSLSVWQDRADQKIQLILQSAKKQGIHIHFVSRQELDRLTQNENHQGIIAYCKPIKNYSENDLDVILENVDKPFLLILDGVQDPHNLGACLRSADAAGVHAVIAPKDKAVGITAVVSKIASGAAENIPFVQVTNLARTMQQLKARGIWIFGAAGEATTNWYDADFIAPVAIALGAEGKGLRRLTREHCDVLLKIPMQGMVSSLNVSVATGIFLFEVVRQRKN